MQRRTGDGVPQWCCEPPLTGRGDCRTGIRDCCPEHMTKRLFHADPAVGPVAVSIGAPVEQLINPCMSVLAPARSASAMWTRASPIHGLDGYVRGACRTVQAASAGGPPCFVAAAVHNNNSSRETVA